MDTEALAKHLSILDHHTLHQLFKDIFAKFPDTIQYASDKVQSSQATTLAEIDPTDITLEDILKDAHRPITEKQLWVNGMDDCLNGKHKGKVLDLRDGESHTWCFDCENIVGRDVKELKHFIGAMQEDVHDMRKVVGYMESGDWTGAYQAWGHLDTSVRDGFSTPSLVYLFALNGRGLKLEQLTEEEKGDPLGVVTQYLLDQQKKDQK